MKCVVCSSQIDVRLSAGPPLSRQNIMDSLLLMFLLIGCILRGTLAGVRTYNEQDVVVVEGDIYVTRGDLKQLGQQENWRRRPHPSGTALEEAYIPVTSHRLLPRRHGGKQGLRSRRAVTALAERLWPNATVPYIIGQNITTPMQTHILQAMGHWEKHTCIRFVNRTIQDDYIVFEPGPCGCCSFVGRKGDGRQIVTLSSHCTVYGVVVHELGHVIGFWHEHSRPDRDTYIKILNGNIMSGKLENFDKKSAFEIDSHGQPYDYYSIMHYRRKTFSRNGQNTIEPRQGRVLRIGQREALSPGDIVQARLLYACPKPQCFEEFTGSEGNFSTPNYPVKYFKDHTCIWIIHVMPGEEVSLEFPDFALERSANCSFDYVELREGIDEMGQLVGRLCGEGDPGIFRSSRSLWLYFSSDASIAHRGFLAHYTKTNVIDSGSTGSGAVDDLHGSGSWSVPTLEYQARCNEYLTDQVGGLSSPLLPVFFRGRLADCSWTIDGGDNASQIQLSITLDMMPRDNMDNCVGDIYQRVTQRLRHRRQQKTKELLPKVVRVNDLYDIDRYAPVRYTCDVAKKLLLTTSTLMLQWSSDTNQPFSLSYVIDYDECALGVAKCEHICRNTVESYTCICKSGFRIHNNRWQCIPKSLEFSDKCGGHLHGERGKIRASTEPMTDCEWRIRLSPDYRIFLTFTKFDVPSSTVITDLETNVTVVNKTDQSNDDVPVSSGISHGNMSCQTNYVEILIGRDKHLKGRYCGDEPPPLIMTGSGSVTVRLHTETNKVLTLPYFSAKYIAFKEKSNRCFHRKKASGNITSPGFPHEYPAHSMCVWRVSARSGHQAHVKFDVMDIEPTRMCHFDYLEVRDGKHRTSPLVGRFCGRRKPTDIFSSGRHLWLMFISDSDGNGRGFRAYLASKRRDTLNWSNVRPPAGVTRVKDNPIDTARQKKKRRRNG